MKTYKLLGADGKEHLSETPGTLGGNSKLKIYGRLDCPSALSTIRRFPGSYEKSRVFFADERAAPKLQKAHQQNKKAVMFAYDFEDKPNSEPACVAGLMKMYQLLTQGQHG